MVLLAPLNKKTHSSNPPLFSLELKLKIGGYFAQTHLRMKDYNFQKSIEFNYALLFGAFCLLYSSEKNTNQAIVNYTIRSIDQCHAINNSANFRANLTDCYNLIFEANQTNKKLRERVFFKKMDLYFKFKKNKGFFTSIYFYCKNIIN